MRNLKKVLAVTVAFVMAFSLMSTGLAVTDYTEFSDVNDINDTYLDAVSLLTALEILAGTDKGEFDPKGDVNRGQMAKMIYVIMNNGVDDLATLYKSQTTPLTDISGHWAEGYIKYCYLKGIIAGVGDNTFKPDDNVTGIQAMKMVLVSLGYDPIKEGYVGYGWAGNIGIGGQNADLRDKVEGIDLNAPISREVAAQIMYNGLFATVVHYVNGVLEKRLGSDGFAPLTFAEDKLSLYTVEGILVANDQVAIHDASIAETGKSVIRIAFDNSSTTRNHDDRIIPASTDYTMVGKAVNAYVKFKSGKNRSNWGNDDISKAFGNIVEQPGKNIVTLGVSKDYTDTNIGSSTKFYVNYSDTYTPQGQTTDVTMSTQTDFDNYYKGLGTNNGFNRASKDDYSGQQIVMISNDSNKGIEYVLGFDRRFGEVTSYSNSMMSITINDNPNYNNGYVNVDFEDIYGYEDVALGDNVLMFKIPGDEYIVEKAGTLTGKMTGTTSEKGEAVAIIDGTRYKIARDHVDPEDVLSSDFINVEVTYYLDGDRICGVDAKGVTKTPDNYCVIKGSKADGTWGKSIDGEEFTAAVYTSNGTDKTYEIDSIYDSDGNIEYNMTDEDGKTTGSMGKGTEVYYYSSNVEARRPIDNLVCKYTINSSGEIVLYLPDLEGTLNGKYDKAAANITMNATYPTVSTGTRKLVDSTTVMFLKSNSDAAYGGDGKWYVYTGRSNLPAVSSADGTSAKMSMMLGKFSVKNDLANAIALSDIAWAKTSANDKYGFVISSRATKSSDGNEWYYESVELFDGEKIITYSAKNGVKLGSQTLKGFNPNADSFYVISYTLDGGKIDEMKQVKLENDATALKDGFLAGYIATAGNTQSVALKKIVSDATSYSYGYESGMVVLTYDGKNWEVKEGAAARSALGRQSEVESRIKDGKLCYNAVVFEDDVGTGLIKWAVVLNDANKQDDMKRYLVSEDIVADELSAELNFISMTPTTAEHTAVATKTGAFSGKVTVDAGEGNGAKTFTVVVSREALSNGSTPTWSDTPVISGLPNVSVASPANSGTTPNLIRTYTFTVANNAPVQSGTVTIPVTIYTSSMSTINLTPIVITVEIGDEADQADLNLAQTALDTAFASFVPRATLINTGSGMETDATSIALPSNSGLTTFTYSSFSYTPASTINTSSTLSGTDITVTGGVEANPGDICGTVSFKVTAKRGTAEVSKTISNANVIAGSANQKTAYDYIVSAIASDFASSTAYTELVKAGAVATIGDSTNTFALNTAGSNSVAYSYTDFGAKAANTPSTVVGNIAIQAAVSGNNLFTATNGAVAAVAGHIGTWTVEVTATRTVNAETVSVVTTANIALYYTSLA